MNTEDLNQEWQRVTELVCSYDADAASQARAFLPRLKPQAMSDDFLMLTADNAWLRSWIQSHYLDAINRALEDLHGKPYLVAIEIDENQQTPSSQPVEHPQATSRADASPSPAAATPKASKTLEAPEAFEARGSLETPDAPREPQAPQNPETHDAPDSPQTPEAAGQPRQIENDLIIPSSSLTFGNFVIGESNRMAYSMAVTVAESPGQPMLNPLFIYGKSGLGKTHLMRAIQNYIAETQPHLTTVYVDSADFLNGYVEATMTHDREKDSYKNFKRKYQDADVLLLDDIQILQGKESTIDIVFQIFNHMVNEGKQIVLSADRAPKNIIMDERNYSRFNSGGTFDIQPPEIETKLGIIRNFIEEYQKTSGREDFTLSEEIQRYIAENSSSNVRELKSAVTKVIYACTAFHMDEISIDEVARLLENHFSGGAMKKLTIGDIQKQVELYYDVTHTDLTGQKRSRKIAYARHIAIYLVREMLDVPYSYIGKSFGGRDHTTIMHSVNIVEKKIKDTREVREEIENIKRLIKEM